MPLLLWDHAIIKGIVLLVLSLCIAVSVQAQVNYATQDTTYRNAVEDALLALKHGDCKRCSAQYKRAFLVSQKSALSTLRAATCAYQCGQIEQARAYVKRAVSLDWEACEDIWGKPADYPELASLHSSPLAADLIHLVDERKIAQGRNPNLERQLQRIFEAD